MADREKVILQCKRAIDTGESVTDYCFYYDVIALLKEQEEKIKALEQTIEDICCGGGA